MNIRIGSLAAAPLLILALGCAEKPEGDALDGEEARAASTPPALQSPAAYEGVVVTTMNAGGYTYVELETELGRIWVAGPEGPMAVGDRVSVRSAMLMQNFTSPALQRDFDEIYFTQAFTRSGESANDGEQPSTLPPGHPPLGGEDEPGIASGSIAKAVGGLSIAEIWAQQEELVGKEVLVRGKVTKFLPEIMHRNWIHIADGSGSGKAATITVTSDQTVAVGDIVLVRATLTRDKDFGAGYRYEVILEKAEIVVE